MANFGGVLLVAGVGLYFAKQMMEAKRKVALESYRAEYMAGKSLVSMISQTCADILTV